MQGGAVLHDHGHLLRHFSYNQVNQVYWPADHNPSQETKMFNRIFTLLIAVSLSVSLNAQAEDSGFLTDYSLLKEDNSLGFRNMRAYEHPDASAKFNTYKAIMIDQPELIVATDSRYKGLKPDDAVKISEAMRAALGGTLTEQYFVVDKPGPEVMLLRVAAANLYLKKAKRGLLSYTPVGAVAYAAITAASDDIAKKISLVEVTIEGELSDSMTGEVIAAFVNERGQRKDKAKNQALEPSSWNELMGILEVLSARVNCRLYNAKLDQAKDHNCVALNPIPVQTK
jgi:hypothetical protein